MKSVLPDAWNNFASEASDVSKASKTIQNEFSYEREEIEDIGANLNSSYEIEEIEGIGKGYGKQLTKTGISTTADLLKKYKDDASLSSVVESLKQEKWVTIMG